MHQVMNLLATNFPSPAREFRVPHRFQLILVWAVWVFATVAMFLDVLHYTRNIPYMDDWAMVPVITGHESISLRWAWTQHNEHRVLLPRLILASLFRWVAPDFRAGHVSQRGPVVPGGGHDDRAGTSPPRAHQGSPTPYCLFPSSLSRNPKSCSSASR